MASVDVTDSTLDAELKNVIDTDTMVEMSSESKTELETQVASPSKGIEIPIDQLVEDSQVEAPTVECNSQKTLDRTPALKGVSRGFAIEKEMNMRVLRVQRLIEQDEELHQAKMEKQND